MVDLEEHKTKVEMTLLALDLAEFYHERGCLEELRQHTAKMFPLLQAARPYPEAYAALIQFQQAANQGVLTPELITSAKEAVWNSEWAL